MTEKRCRHYGVNVIQPENHSKAQKQVNLEGCIHDCIKSKSTKIPSVQDSIGIREKIDGVVMLVVKLKRENEEQEKRIETLEKGNDLQ